MTDADQFGDEQDGQPRYRRVAQIEPADLYEAPDVEPPAGFGS